MNEFPLIGITGRALPPAPYSTVPAQGSPQTYIQAVRQAGGLPLVVPPDLEEREAGPLLARLDGLLLSGGGDVAPEWYGESDSSLLDNVDRERDRAELALVRRALRKGLPVLAICRGIQVLNVALGGTLYLDIAADLPGALAHRPAPGESNDASAHSVRLLADSRLASILGTTTVQVNSYHHQAARAVGQELTVTALAPDGIVEALEHSVHPFCIGVQWHPEVHVAEWELMARLFEAFVAAAGGC